MPETEVRFISHEYRVTKVSNLEMDLLFILLFSAKLRPGSVLSHVYALLSVSCFTIYRTRSTHSRKLPLYASLFGRFGEERMSVVSRSLVADQSRFSMPIVGSAARSDFRGFKLSQSSIVTLAVLMMSILGGQVSKVRMLFTEFSSLFHLA